ncbi:MAG: hypothetical protein RIF41_34240, partial [Polyangiaceae bacterium]
MVSVAARERERRLASALVVRVGEGAAERIDVLDGVAVLKAPLGGSPVGERGEERLGLGVEPILYRAAIGDPHAGRRSPRVEAATHHAAPDAEADELADVVVAVDVVDAARIDVALDQTEVVALIPVDVPTGIGHARLMAPGAVLQLRVKHTAGLGGRTRLGVPHFAEDVAPGNVAPAFDAPLAALDLGVLEVPDETVRPCFAEQVVFVVVVIARLGTAGVDDPRELTALVELVGDEALGVLDALGVAHGEVPNLPARVGAPLGSPSDRVGDADDLAILPIDLDAIVGLVAQRLEPVAPRGVLSEHANHAVAEIEHELGVLHRDFPPVGQDEDLALGRKGQRRLAPLVVDEGEVLSDARGGPFQGVRPPPPHPRLTGDTGRRIASREAQPKKAREREVDEGPGEHRAGDDIHRM